jgi:hypothetical protein
LFVPKKPGKLTSQSLNTGLRLDNVV